VDRQTYRRRVLVIVLSCSVLLCIFGLPYLIREARHWRHYQQLEVKKEYSAKFLELSLAASEGKPGAVLSGKLSVQNAGTQPWKQGVHYFAIGVKGAPVKIATGDPKLAADDALGDRLVIHQDIKPGDPPWERSFQLTLPPESGKHTIFFQMVKEGEYPGWFGEMKGVDMVVR